MTTHFCLTLNLIDCLKVGVWEVLTVCCKHWLVSALHCALFRLYIIFIGMGFCLPNMAN